MTDSGFVAIKDYYGEGYDVPFFLGTVSWPVRVWRVNVRMTVKELIESLSKFPPDAEVYYLDGPLQDQIYAEEIEPSPKLESDGRVKL